MHAADKRKVYNPFGCIAVAIVAGISGLTVSPDASASIVVTVKGTRPSCSGVWVGNNEDGYDCVNASFFYGDGGGYSGAFDWGPSGGGGGPSGSTIAAEEQAEATDPCSEASGGGVTSKPVIISTGTKILPELDFIVPPDDFPLKLTRLYDKNLSRVGIFGSRWASNLEISLTREYGTIKCTGSLSGTSSCSPGTNPLTKVLVNGESGYATEFSLVGGVWTSPEGGTIEQSGTTWVQNSPQGVRTSFDASGRPLSVKNERGIGLFYSYNASNQLAAVTHTSGRSISLTWSGTKVATATAPNGSVYSYAYGTNGLLVNVVYPGNLGTRTYHYEDSTQPGGLTGISINGVRYSRYAYLSNGKVSWSGLEGGAEKSTFTYAANYTEVTNALGHTTHYEYASVAGKRRLIWVERGATVGCSGGFASTTYDVNGNADIETDHFGVKTDFDFAPDGRLLQKISGIGPNGEADQQQITQYVWDPSRNSRLSQINVFGSSTSQPLRSTTYTYYPDGDVRERLVQSIAVANQGSGPVGTLTTNYNYVVRSDGQLASMTVDGPLPGTGDSVTSSFDTSGNLLTVSNALGHTLTYSNYNALGQPGVVTTPNGAVTQFTYNERGQRLTRTQYVNGSANTTATTYDTRGRPVRTVEPDGYYLDIGYDAFDRVTSIFKTNQLPDLDEDYNRSETFRQAVTYNLLSQPLTTTSTYTYAAKTWDEIAQKPRSVGYVDTQHKITNEYDATGLLSKRRGQHGQSLTYHYNANGDVDWIEDAQLNRASFEYDRMRRVRSITDAANATTLVAYNPLGLTATVTDARSHATTYSYDGLGNLLSQSSPDTGLTQFTLNGLGQRIQAQRADMSVIGYSYDAIGRLATMTSGGQTRTYSYDSCANGKGLLCTASTSGGELSSASFAYTPWGQIATRQDELDGTIQSTGYSYDGLLRLAGINYPSGLSVGYGYSNGNLSSITANVAGSPITIASISDYQFQGPSRSLVYGNGLWQQRSFDTDGRMTSLSVSGNASSVTQSLTYNFNITDGIAQITNGTDANLTQSYSYDNVDRLVGAAFGPGGGSAFDYDATGNRTSYVNSIPTTNTSYVVSASSNRLTQAITSGLVRAFNYNPNGDLTSFTDAGGVNNTLLYDPFGRLATHSRSGVTTSYVVNALDQRIGKFGPSGGSRYVYAGFNNLLAENTNGVWTSYIWNGGEPVAIVRNNQVYYLHNDHLGRPDVITNSAKAIVWKANNFAFGRTVTTDMIGGLNLGFPGQYFDAESGLWHNGYRDYMPDTGRYVESDPVGLLGGANTYTYVGSNVVNSVDPYGLFDVMSFAGPGGTHVYQIQFYSASLGESTRNGARLASSIVGRFGKVGKATGASGKMQPDKAGVSKVGDKKARKKCDSLDEAAMEAFKKANPNVSIVAGTTLDTVSRAQMESFLNGFFADNPSMVSVYGGTQLLLDRADAGSRDQVGDLQH